MKPKIIEKRWDKGFEEEIRRYWKESGIFRFDEKSDRPVFSIDTPPPYVNAPIHMGHAATYTIMDMIARFKRMTGFNVLFPLGMDRNGLPIEVAAEKEFNVLMTETPRERFLELCERILEKSSSKSIEIFYKLGHSYNSWKPGKNIGDMYYTDSEDYRKLTQETFIDLWNMGLIYRDKKVSNYCPHCQTTLADAEIEYRDIETEFVNVVWKVKETGEKIIIGTTRPELICTCQMVIYNPEDERYKHLEGKHAVLPIYGREVPIRAHPYAKIEKGTGLVMMCSYGDYTDIRFFREMKLKEVIAINRDGRMNEHAGFLKGLKVHEARKKMIETLERNGLVESRKRVKHRTPICERSKTPVEFIYLTEYYLKQMDFLTDLKRVAEKIKFYAPHSKQLLMDWINSLSMDWAISRRRYYATEIPLWYCKSCGEVIVPEKGRYYRPWKEEPPVKECPRCGGREFIGEERVFDTWFDSSISPLYILGYGKDTNFFKKHMPCSLRPQGKEIVRTWLYYTLLRCYQLTKKPIFENVWIHFHILDEHGTKMSKSLGNVIDPEDVVERFGAEPFRLWCALEGNITTMDLRCSFERIEGAAKFLTKLWNVSRFISMFEEPDGEVELMETDRWILREISELIKYVRRHYEEFDFHGPATRIKHFVWETFASHYLEIVKSRVYNQDGKFTKKQQNAAIYTLHKVLKDVLIMLSPIACFITHKLYKNLYGKDIEKETFPEPDREILRKKPDFTTEELIELNSWIWKEKKDKGLSLKSELLEITIPEKFRGLEDDLKAAHNVSRIKYGEERSIVF
ncbi:MAG TPA: valine--tRNA ligase [Candidatus Aenigmarchaeota archaeon]|nr:valine--tRNA ligase [Candidatus Aenigmarchaeota archaeon]